MKTKIYYSLNKGIPFFLHKWGAAEVESTTPCLSFRESECKVYVIIKKVTLITLCGAGEITDPVISHWRSASIFTCKNKFVIYRKGIRGSVRLFAHCIATCQGNLLQWRVGSQNYQKENSVLFPITWNDHKIAPNQPSHVMNLTKSRCGWNLPQPFDI